ncbi:MAG: NUDIX hydrolase, partial [Tumebacillaceae bacterium]
PNGNQSTREVVLHPGAVTVLAITEDDKVLLVRQYRNPCDTVLIEAPAGKLEKNEDPLEAAKRELEEETGYTANKWQHLSSFYTSPGFSNEILHAYVATELTKTAQNLDNDEFLDLIAVTADEVQEMLNKGEIVDSKTLTFVYWWLAQKALGKA